MKTAEEWISLISGLNNSSLVIVNKLAIQEIQLDAVKEGMRRAAATIDVTEPSAPSVRKAIILTAADQLTTKDL